MVSRVREWLMERAAMESGSSPMQGRGLPKGIGWWHTLGVVAVGLLLAQAVTGIFMAMYYSPHPQGAWESVRFLNNNLPMGRLVRGLHHYGDSAVIVVMGLHLLRTYFHAAYKRPRELNWLLGIGIFSLVLGFGFTGSALPWDQKAYWATVVRAQYFEGIPLVGPMLQQLLLGGKEVGTLTLTRFFAIHALLLPALLVPLLIWHVRLAVRQGPTPPGVPVGESAPVVAGAGDQATLRNAVALFVAFALVFGLALLRPVELEFKANPMDSTYHPRAEWYFMFLFQMVQDLGRLIPALPGWLVALGVPGLGMTFLALAPWIDRCSHRKASRRLLMIAPVVLALLVMAGFGARSYLLLKPNATPSNSLFGHYTEAGRKALEPELVAAGKVAFVKCQACHVGYQDYTIGKSGPDLTGYGLTTFLGEVEGHPEVKGMSFYDRFEKYIRGDVRPSKTMMPKYTSEMLSDEELRALGAYLSQTLPEAERAAKAEAAAAAEAGETATPE